MEKAAVAGWAGARSKSAVVPAQAGTHTA